MPPADATLQLLQEAQQKLGLSEAETEEGTNGPATDEDPKSGIRRAVARCWAPLLARIYEGLPLRCERCDEPMRIIAFVLDPPLIERILGHIDEPTIPPRGDSAFRQPRPVGDLTVCGQRS